MTQNHKLHVDIQMYWSGIMIIIWPFWMPHSKLITSFFLFTFVGVQFRHWCKFSQKMNEGTNFVNETIPEQIWLICFKINFRFDKRSKIFDWRWNINYIFETQHAVELKQQVILENTDIWGAGTTYTYIHRLIWLHIFLNAMIAILLLKYLLWMKANKTKIKKHIE